MPRHRLAIAREDLVLARMTAVAHHPAPGDHHVAHRAPAGTEDRRIERRRRAARRRAQGRRRSSTTKSARRPARDRADGLRGRARRRRRGLRVERLPDRHIAPSASTLRSSTASRCDHSSWRSSAKGSTIVFESLPMPNAPPRVEKRARRERAVAKIGFGRRREPGDGAARREPRCLVAPSCASHGRCTSGHRDAHDRAAIRPAARRTQATQSATSRTCSAAWMWIGAPAATSATTAASSSGVTARRLCGATPSVYAAAPSASRARAATRRANESSDVDEAALRRGGRRAAESAVRVEHRQQRQRDAGVALPRRSRAARARPGPRTRCRRDRDARSEIRATAV